MYKNNNDITSHDVYSPEMLKELDNRSKNIRFAITRMDVDIEKASVNLYWIYSTKAYKAMGHESIIDYALAEFDISKSTTYNYITLAERFGHRDENYNLLFDGFDEKYKSYSSSKLNLLAPFTDEEIEGLDISPKMSVRNIKEKLKDSSLHKKDYLDNLFDSSKSNIENSKKDDAPGNDDNELTDDFKEDDEADDEGIICYSLETLLSFNFKEYAAPFYLYDVLNEIILDAFKVHDHSDTRIEINVRYPVTKQDKISDFKQEFSKIGKHVYI